MKKLLLVSSIVLLTFTSKLSAQFVNIPDANFKTFLLGNSSINTVSDGEISYAEANAYNGSIFAGTQAISDLTGIEAFINLTILDVSQNSLTTIDLSQNVALTSFNCNLNSLTCLDLSNNPNLTSVDCSSNNLTKLNLKNGTNPILTTMNCTGNAIGLTCIQVDNAAASMAAPGWAEDTWSVYSVLCTQPVAGFTTNAPVCYGSAITFTNTSANSNQWYWDFGDFGTPSTLQNPTYTYGSIGNYMVMLVAQNCYGKDTILDTVIQGKSIYGTASYTLGPITGGTAVLMPYLSYYTAFDTCQTAPVNAVGNYFFQNVLEGDYVIKIFPDTILNPTLLNTYFLDGWAWDSATVLTHGCTADDVANVTMVETLAGTGPGVLHGIVQEGIGFGRANGDPVHGVDVKLGITGMNQIVAQTTTNLLGEYTFNGLAYGNYSIYVDIPGLERDSVYDVTLSLGTDSLMSLNYLVDSVAIYVLPNIGIEEVDAADPNFKIYPNPVSENANIAYTIYSDANIKLDIYNIFGMKVTNLFTGHQNSGDYVFNFNTATNRLTSGIYFIALSGDGKTKVKRIVVNK